MEYVIIIISAVFVNNIVLIKFLGICPFIGVSNKVETSIGMTGAVTFVMVIATIVTYLLQVYVLEPLNITFMQTITFILVIAYWFAARKAQLPTRARRAVHALLHTAVLQVALGIATLLLAVPVMLGAAHQGVAMLLFTVALYLVHALRRV